MGFQAILQGDFEHDGHVHELEPTDKVSNGANLPFIIKTKRRHTDDGKILQKAGHLFFTGKHQMRDGARLPVYKWVADE